jgi:hypothetical protein
MRLARHPFLTTLCIRYALEILLSAVQDQGFSLSKACCYSSCHHFEHSGYAGLQLHLTYRHDRFPIKMRTASCSALGLQIKQMGQYFKIKEDEDKYIWQVRLNYGQQVVLSNL